MTLLLGTSLVPYGIDMARPGLLTARDVLNTLPLREFCRAVRPAA
jgi:hypothetical protein